MTDTISAILPSGLRLYTSAIDLGCVKTHAAGSTPESWPQRDVDACRCAFLFLHLVDDRNDLSTVKMLAGLLLHYSPGRISDA